MPNFCAITISGSYDNARISQSVARINDAEDAYDYAYSIRFIPKRKLKFVFTQDTLDTDITNLKCVYKNQNELLMNWSTNAAGVNVGFETLLPSDNDDLDNKINTFDSIMTALTSLTDALGIGGLD